jgi:hypothetical protein
VVKIESKLAVQLYMDALHMGAKIGVDDFFFLL